VLLKVYLSIRREKDPELVCAYSQNVQLFTLLRGRHTELFKPNYEFCVLAIFELYGHHLRRPTSGASQGSSLHNLQSWSAHIGPLLASPCIFAKCTPAHYLSTSAKQERSQEQKKTDLISSNCFAFSIRFDHTAGQLRHQC
jgi:hypothetical protein